MSTRTPEGVTLRCFRFALDLTEEKLGAPSGTSGHLISRWELGKIPLSPDRLVQVLEPHGVPPEAVEQVLVPAPPAAPAVAGAALSRRPGS